MHKPWIRIPRLGPISEWSDLQIRIVALVMAGVMISPLFLSRKQQADVASPAAPPTEPKAILQQHILPNRPIQYDDTCPSGKLVDIILKTKIYGSEDRLYIDENLIKDRVVYRYIGCNSGHPIWIQRKDSYLFVGLAYAPDK